MTNEMRADSVINYDALPATLTCMETGDGIRVYIPIRRRERAILSLWMLGTLTLAACATAVAFFTALSTLGSIIAFGLLIFFGVVILALAAVSTMAMIRIRGTIVEIDGRSLRARGYRTGRVREWPAEKVRPLTVIRLPALPLGNLAVQAGHDHPVRVGYYEPKELAEAAERLNQALDARRKTAATTP